MFTRLANTRVQKNVEPGQPVLRLQGNSKIVFTSEAVLKLKIDQADRFDVLKNDLTNKFYIANVGKEGKEGRELSKSNSVMHERISKELGGKGNIYKITDTVVEFENVDWYELELVSTKVEAEVVVKEPVAETVA